MTVNPNLLEYLAIEAFSSSSDAFTGHTEVEDENYDAPDDIQDVPGLTLSSGFLDIMETAQSRAHFGGALKNIERGAESSTAITASDESYDEDNKFMSMGIPDCVYKETSYTKVSGETFDDDSSIESLGIPDL